MKKFAACAVAMSTMLSGCAAMFHGSTQQVAIRSNVPGTELYVNEAYVITARKTGCEAASVPAEKTFDAVTLLGVLIDFGVVSVLLVDGAATGAWEQFTQTSYVVDPHCA